MTFQVAAGDLILASHINKAAAWRNPVSQVADPASSAAVGTTETAVLTLPSTTYKANTAFLLKVYPTQYTTSAVNLRVYARVRKTNTAGLVVCDFGGLQELPANNTLGHKDYLEAIFTTAAAVTASLVLTLVTVSGTVQMVGSAAHTRRMKVFEIGDQADFVDDPDLT